jgi:hypothetical protein
MVLAGFYMLCRMMTTKELLINRACVVQDYKPVTYALLPNQRVHLQFYRETLLEQHRNSELKTRSTQPQAWLFLLSAHQRDMRSDAVQDPYILPAVRSIEYRVWSVPVDEQDPVQNFKRQFEASLAKKARAVHQWNQSRECSTMALSSSVCY